MSLTYRGYPIARRRVCDIFDEYDIDAKAFMWFAWEQDGKTMLIYGVRSRHELNRMLDKVENMRRDLREVAQTVTEQ